MSDAPRIWLEYRPVRIGWVIPDRDMARLTTAASWSSCLWGGRFNPILPIHDAALAVRLVRVFGVDLLIPIEGTPATQAFVDRFPHLRHNRWRNPIFQQGRCEFADIRHVLRRIYRDQDNRARANLILPIWDQVDALDPFFTVLLGRYPPPGDEVADYRAVIRNEFDVSEPAIPANGELPPDLLNSIPPIPLTAYGMTRQRDPTGWLNPGVVLGSANDFDDLVLFWNLRAAGAPVCFYDQTNSARLRSYANGFLDKFRGRARGRPDSRSSPSLSCPRARQINKSRRG
jgi:hypothetical protein